MIWYFHFLDLLVLVFIIVMIRHLTLRGRFFLHIFQLNGYQFNEYAHWIFKKGFWRTVTAEHIFINTIIFALLIFFSSMITGSAAVLILCVFGLFWFAETDFYGGKTPKKSMVFTPRMIRLAIPFTLLGLLIPVLSIFISYFGFIPFTALQIKGSVLDAFNIYILVFGLVLGDLILPFWVFIAGLITQPVENYVHHHFIKEAQSKLEQMTDLTVIAITGSYGKTSTKFMIRDLLSERYAVCATPGSYNTPMGICKVINNDLESHHQILVLEMGARYEGNISELCDIVEPHISVVTNVGIAHLETFGSQDAIAETKSTLVKRTRKAGTAILNGDDKRVQEMGTLRDDLDIVYVGMEAGEIRASHLQYSNQGTQFVINDGKHEQKFSMKLLGAHNVQNMLLAAGVTRKFNIRLATMAAAAEQMEPVEHRLELKRQGKITIIDDAFNSNPVGAKNAVEILGQFQGGRRIIITPGMIELGDLQAEKNRAFGKQLGEAQLDLIILVGKKQTKMIYEGLKSAGHTLDHVEVVKSLDEANECMQEFVQEGDVVLYENDLPDDYDE